MPERHDAAYLIGHCIILLPMKTIKELLDLKGKTAIVTGGAVGIGYGISYRLAEAGANVVIADKTPSEGEHAAKELSDKGFSATAVATDVSDENAVKRMVEETVKKYGTIDILVNNAGIFPPIPVMQMSLKDFDYCRVERLISIHRMAFRHIQTEIQS